MPRRDRTHLRWLLLWPLLLAPLAAGAEERGGEGGERLLLIGSPEAEGGLSATDLASTVAVYLQDLGVELVVLEHPIPRGEPDEQISQARALAEPRGAAALVWLAPSEGGGLRLLVLWLGDGEPRLRSIPLEEQPPAILRRTIAAMIRTVVESEVRARDEATPGRLVSGEGSPRAPEGDPDVERADRETGEPEGGGSDTRGSETGRTTLGLSVAYGFRLPQGPGPMHQTLGLGFWLRAWDWIGLVVEGRLGLPANIVTPEGGTAWHGALVAGVGLDHQLRAVAIGGLIGADLEWIQGSARTGQEDEERAFEHLGAGVFARFFLRIRLWRWLGLLIRVETALRPQRMVFLLHGQPAAGSGFIELGLHLGLTFRLM